MSRFRVAFDGKWQQDFDTLSEAVVWVVRLIHITRPLEASGLSE